MNSCSFSNYTNSQWVDSTVLQNPLPDQPVSSTGYVSNYGKYASGFINPEYGFWKEMNGQAALTGPQLALAMNDTYSQFNTQGIFNGKRF